MPGVPNDVVRWKTPGHWTGSSGSPELGLQGAAFQEGEIALTPAAGSALQTFLVSALQGLQCPCSSNSFLYLWSWIFPAKFS